MLIYTPRAHVGPDVVSLSLQNPVDTRLVVQISIRSLRRDTEKPCVGRVLTLSPDGAVLQKHFKRDKLYVVIDILAGTCLSGVDAVCLVCHVLPENFGFKERGCKSSVARNPRYGVQKTSE